MSISSRSLSFLLGGICLLGLLPGPASAQTVNLDAFDLPPGKTVTVEFQVTVDSPMPPGDNSVQNQGSVTGTNIAALLTNDPDTGAADDPTITTILLIADLSITKTDGATTEVPGTPVTYTIVAANAGPATVADGVVTDTFPAILTGCAWTASVTAGTASGFDATGSGNINDTGITMAASSAITYVVTCNIAPNATGSLANTASISSAATSDPTPANNSATDSDTLVPSTDVTITKTDSATDEVPGTGVTYTIVASNIGPSTATGVTVADTFPGILSACSTGSVAAGGATGHDAGPTAGNINDTGITLPPAATVTYTATCTISAAATGSLANTATISSTTTDPVGGNNSATDTDTLTPSADVAITKTDGSATEVPGTPVTYTIVASNTAGPSVATGVTVADTFPGTLSGCSTTSVAAGGATGNDAGPTAGNINDGGITLPVGGSVTYTATCNISPTATGSLANTATITSGIADPNAGNNSATDTDTLNAANDVAVTKTDSSATEVPGTPVTYTMVVSNATGPSTATAVTFTDNFPADLSACSTSSVAAGGATGHDPGPTLGNISDTGITLPAGSTVTYTATCNIAVAATGSLANTATVAIGGGGDGNAANNTATDTDTLVPAADLAITKTNGVSSVSPGTLINYVIQVSNAGPSTSTGITVTDTFPATLSGCTWSTTTTGSVSGHDASGSGNINDSGITMAPAATLTYTTANCLLDSGATGSLANTASVSATTADPNAGDNSATDTDTIQPFDYGDAPSAAQSGFAASYPTLAADDGARHVATGPSLGANRDIEGNGQPSLGATADDTTGAPDDEDGVSFSAMVACQAGTATVNASAPASLNAWLDWNRDGDWADVGEQIATDQALVAGNNTVNFTVPCAASLGTSYARFRLATATGLSFIGQSTDGEVEDHSVTLTASSNLGVTKTDGLTSAIPGQTPIVYTIVASNAGPSPATASLMDTFPGVLGCGWTSASAGGASGNTNNPSAAALNETLSLPVGSSVTYTVNCTIAPAATGTLSNTAAIASTLPQNTDPVPGNNSATDNTTLTPQVNLGVTKTDGATSEIPGTPVTYLITVSNAGPSTDPNATLADTFAGILSGCSTTSVAAGGATGNDAGPVAGNLNDTGLNLPPGSSVTYTATCNIAASATGTLVNTATATASVTDTNGGNNSATDSDTLVPTADVAISKTDGAASEIPGTPVTYTIVVSNAAGPSVATGVSVVDSFPATLTGCSTTSTAAGGATGNDAGPVAGSFTDSGITLPVGGSVTYTAACTVDQAATGSLANTASVTSGSTDPNTANNSATDTNTLNVTTDVSVTKTDATTTEVPGTPVTYTIVVANSGPSTATPVTLADTFPATLSACSTSSVAAGGASGHDPGPTLGNLNDTGITLPSGSSVTYTATCNIDPAATGSLVNTATITNPSGDSNPANNSATDTDTLVPAADVAITKTDGTASVSPGSTVNYVIAVSNAGPSTSTGITVADTFPATLSGCTWTTATTGSVSGHDPSGTGNINDAGITMAPAATLTYTTANCVLDGGASGTLVNTATANATTADPNPADNSATDTDTILPLDYGDAPSAAQSGFAAGYPVLLADNGARHVLAGPTLGANRDMEANGQPSLGATADDTTGTPDDEDGVSFGTLTACQAGTATANASAPGRLNGWIDWNRDGDWADVGEQVATDQLLVAGNNTVNFTVPCTVALGTSYARFRLSTATGLGFIGQAADGEVEDHSVTLTASGDLSVTKTDGLTSAIPGQTTVVYTIVASNAGPSPIAGVSLTDTFSPGVLSCGFTSVAAGGASGNTNNPAAVALNELLSLPVAASVTYTVTCTINPAATGTLVNTATIATTLANTSDPTPGNNSATDNTTLTPQANLGVTKTDSATTEVPGTPVTYTIVVTNAGPSVEPNASLTDTFAASLSGCSTTSVAAGGASGNDGGPVAGNLNDTGLNLPVGASVTYTATCNIAAAATGTLVNTATAAGSVTDPTPGNNSATDTDTLTPQADLSITKTDSATSEIPGTSVTYTLVASNAGPSVEPSATVADVFAASLSACSTTSVAAGGASGNDPGPTAGNINDSAINLPVGGSVTYTATCTIAPDATGNLVNTAGVGASVTDPNTANNAATDTDTLTPQGTLAITKTDGLTQATSGTSLTYTIFVSNGGPSTDPAVLVTDTFPVGLSCGWTSTALGGATGNTNNVGPANLNDTVSLPPGASVTYTATCAIASSATGTLSNTATATTSIGGSSVSATDNNTVLVQSADLTIVKGADPLEAFPSMPLTYTIVVNNLGPSDAQNVVVTDNLPPDVTFVSSSGCNESPGGGAPTCTIGTLAAGATRTVIYNTMVVADPSGTWDNTASVVSTTPDPTTPNTSTVTVVSDIIPPTVLALLDSDNNPISACSSLRRPVSTLSVRFDEEMEASVNGLGPDDANNPANYLLVTTGPDRDFATTGCQGGVAGDDVGIVINSVNYSIDTPSYPASTAVLNLNGGTRLPNGLYRLYACGTTTLTDLVGNPLDGNADGTGGDDFMRNFRVDTGNLFNNGHFDCSAASWTPTGAGIAYDPASDADASPRSGSEAFTTTNNLSQRIRQCVVFGQLGVGDSAPYLFTGRARMQGITPNAVIGTSPECTFYGSTDCTGASLGTQSQSGVVLSHTGGIWLNLTFGVNPPAAATSASCGVTLDNPLQHSAVIGLDQLRLEGVGDIFRDGFEGP